ncbi:hypothetical protein [Kitasatospora kifunensis]|uniref:Uncharacterized protein n=1 Tax=Kitasatospora kifunensis TaxID=58351 RepID=A0A7W7QXM0_KITKI|nr:hypothetical protein [Kitasatospora kifunensis]MBB4921647.1 hypothetical protein [Kitasatospora kifunensis]
MSNALETFCAAVSSLTVPQAASPAVSRAAPVATTTVARAARAMAVLMVLAPVYGRPELRQAGEFEVPAGQLLHSQAQRTIESTSFSLPSLEGCRQTTPRSDSTRTQGPF